MVRPYPRPKPQRLQFGDTRHLSIVGDVLYIGKHAYSQYDCVIVGLTTEQALEYMIAGYKVRCSAKGSTFLGRVNTEHVLYLTIDIPRHFDMDKIRLWRLQTNLIDREQKATIEFGAKYWCFENSDKEGYKLSLEEIYNVDDEEEGIDTRSGFEVLKDLERLTDDYDRYVQRQRAAVMPVMSRHSFEQQQVRGIRTSPRKITDADKREHEAYRAHRHPDRGVVEAHMKVGDVMGFNGDEYLIGKIDDLVDEWGVRLDQKFEPSVFFRIAK